MGEVIKGTITSQTKITSFFIDSNSGAVTFTTEQKLTPTELATIRESFEKSTHIGIEAIVEPAKPVFMYSFYTTNGELKGKEVLRMEDVPEDAPYA